MPVEACSSSPPLPAVYHIIACQSYSFSFPDAIAMQKGNFNRMPCKRNKKDCVSSQVVLGGETKKASGKEEGGGKPVPPFGPTMNAKIPFRFSHPSRTSPFFPQS